MRADKLTLARSSRSRSPTCRATPPRSRCGGWPRPPVDDAARPRRRDRAARATAPRSSTPKRSRAAGRCPGSTIPSIGVARRRRRSRRARAPAARPRRRRPRRRGCARVRPAHGRPATTTRSSTRCGGARDADACGSSRPRDTSTTASRRSCSPSPAPIPIASRKRRRAASPSTSGSRSPRFPSGTEVGFVDVPGHVRFLKNMLAGVGAVDVALFVVAAGDGWMPQSEEHLRILELLGVRHGVVALTNADTVDADHLDCASSSRRAAGDVVARDARRSSCATRCRVAASTTCAPRSTRVLGDGARTGRDRRPAPALDRPGVRGPGRGHRRDRHARRRRRRGRRRRSASCGLRPPVRVRGIETRPPPRRARRARDPGRAQPRRGRPPRPRPRRRARARRPVARSDRRRRAGAADPRRTRRGSRPGCGRRRLG